MGERVQRRRGKRLPGCCQLRPAWSTWGSQLPAAAAALACAWGQGRGARRASRAAVPTGCSGPLVQSAGPERFLPTGLQAWLRISSAPRTVLLRPAGHNASAAWQTVWKITHFAAACRCTWMLWPFAFLPVWLPQPATTHVGFLSSWWINEIPRIQLPVRIIAVTLQNLHCGFMDPLETDAVGVRLICCCSCYNRPKIRTVLKCHLAPCHPKFCCLPFFCQWGNDVCLHTSNALGTGYHILVDYARK